MLAGPRIGIAADSVRLDAEPAPVGCPDIDALRSEIVRQLGRDPFSADAQRIFTVRWRRVGADLEALLAVVQAAEVRGRRRLVSRADECVALHRAVALMLTFALDPMRLGEPLPVGVVEAPEPVPESRVAEGPPEPAAVEAPPAQTEPAAIDTPPGQPDAVGAPAEADVDPPGIADGPAETSRPTSPGAPTAADSRPPADPPTEVQQNWTLGLRGAWGMTPSFASGARVGLTWHGRLLSAGAAAVAVLSPGEAVSGGSVSGGLIAAEVFGGLRLGAFDLELAALGGWLPAWGAGFAIDAAGNSPFLGVGVRAGYRLNIGDQRVIRPAVELTRPVVGARLRIDDETAWQTPALAVSAGADVIF